MNGWKSSIVLSVWVVLSGVAFAGETKPVTDPDGVWRIEAPKSWTVQRPGAWSLVASPDETANVVVFTEPRGSGTLGDWLAALIPQLEAEIPGWKLKSRRPARASSIARRSHRRRPRRGILVR